jgi:hypothetical protein
MDQAIHNEIVFLIHDIGTNIGSCSLFTSGKRTISSNVKKSGSLRWP